MIALEEGACATQTPTFFGAGRNEFQFGGSDLVKLIARHHLMYTKRPLCCIPFGAQASSLAGKSGSVIVCSRGVEVPAPGLSRRHLPPCGREGSQLINSLSIFGGLQIIRHHRRKLKCSQPTDFEQNHQWSQAMHYAF